MKLRLSKKFLFFILVLILIGLFIFFFLSFPVEEKEVTFGKEEISPDIELPVSSAYRYDFEKREYFSDKGESWQNSDFTRYIYDLSPKNSELDKCYYLFYNNITKEVVTGGQRKCNFNLIITVGQDKSCFSQGENACTLYIYAVDKTGLQGEMTAVTYHIYWEKPKVEKVTIE